MVTPAAGEVVLVPFPFSNLAESKVRPAVCLVGAGRGDWILCQVTSQPYGDPGAVVLDDLDFASGGLSLQSFARPGKLFTAHQSLLLRAAGRLTDAAHERVVDAVVNLLRHGNTP